MWGFSSRGARLGDRRRVGRAFQAGLGRITVRGPAEHAVLQVEGDLDFTNVDDIAEFALALPHPVHTFDLRGLEFIDGDAVLRMRELARQLGRVWEANPPAMTGMRTSVEKVFTLVADRDAVLAGSR